MKNKKKLLIKLKMKRIYEIYNEMIKLKSQIQLIIIKKKFQ